MIDNFLLRSLSLLLFLSCFLGALGPEYEPYYLEYDPQEYYCLDVAGRFYMARNQDGIDWDNCISVHLKPTDSLFDPAHAARAIILDDSYNH